MKPKVAITQDTTWKRALNAARRTIGKAPLDKEPSEEWKRKAIMAEHSPIKLVEYTIMFSDLRVWVGIHLLRHEHTLPFIHSQRDDRREDIDKLLEKTMSVIEDDIKNDPDFNKRDWLPQGQPNDQDFVVNAQTLINISRKRLCSTASKETRFAWQLVKDTLKEVDPTIVPFMVKNCIYRGFCPEFNTCGYWVTTNFKKELNEYRNLIGRGE